MKFLLTSLLGLRWAPFAAPGLALAVAGWGCSWPQCAGLSLRRLLLWNTGSRCADSSAPEARGTLPEQTRTRVPCMDRLILIHCATMRVLRCGFYCRTYFLTVFGFFFFLTVFAMNEVFKMSFIYFDSFDCAKNQIQI